MEAAPTSPKVESALCPSCGASSPFVQLGSASGRKHYRCPRCGPWREKNAAAVALGALGGKASAERLTQQEHQERMRAIAEKRWKEERARRKARNRP